MWNKFYRYYVSMKSVVGHGTRAFLTFKALRWHSSFFLLLLLLLSFFRAIKLAISCESSTQPTIYMKPSRWFLSNVKAYFLAENKNIVNLSLAELIQKVEKVQSEGEEQSAKTLVKIFSRRQIGDIFLISFFDKTGFDISCKLSPMVSDGDNLHEISNPVFWEL